MAVAVSRVLALLQGLSSARLARYSRVHTGHRYQTQSRGADVRGRGAAGRARMELTVGGGGGGWHR